MTYDALDAIIAERWNPRWPTTAADAAYVLHARYCGPSPMTFRAISEARGWKLSHTRKVHEKALRVLRNPRARAFTDTVRGTRLGDAIFGEVTTKD